MSRIPNTATHIPFDEPISVSEWVELLSSAFYNILNKAKVGILTASSNGYFVTVKEAKIIVLVTELPLQRHTKIVSVTLKPFQMHSKKM